MTSVQSISSDLGLSTPAQRPGQWSWGFATLLAAALLGGGAFLAPGALQELQLAEILALFALSTNVVVGVSGYVSFGQSLFYGAGAYTVALGWYHYHLSFWELAMIAPLVAGVLALPVGLLALRTRKWFFALITLGFTQMAYAIVEQAYGYTQGDTGIFGPMIPSTISNPRGAYYFIAGVAMVSGLLLYIVGRSPLGLTLRASRDNRRRVESLGVSVYRLQLLGFVISAIFAAIAGVLLAVDQQAAYPNLFEWFEAGTPLLAIIIGGLDSFAGPIIGAFIYEYASQYISTHSTHWELFIGIVLIVVILVQPEGLAGAARSLPRYLRRIPDKLRRREAIVRAEHP